MKEEKPFKRAYFNGHNVGNYISDKLSLPEDFLFGLQEEDDWGFVIKTSALLETAINESLAKSIKDEVVLEHLIKLNLQGATGKLPLAKKLECIHPDLAALCKAFAPIRNKFVHSTDYLNLSLNDYIAQMPQSDYDRLFNSLPFTSNKKYEGPGNELSIKEYFKENPRMGIFLALCNSLVNSFMSDIPQGSA